MTVQHLDDLIRAQRKLLWILAPGEREQRLHEVRADYLYEDQLASVAGEMAAEREVAQS